MEHVYAQLAREIEEREGPEVWSLCFQTCILVDFSTSISQRLLLAISGVPGSGKTTLSSSICALLNAKVLEVKGTKANKHPAARLCNCCANGRISFDKEAAQRNAGPCRGLQEKGRCFYVWWQWYVSEIGDYLNRIFLPALLELVRELKREGTAEAPSWSHA